MDFPVGLTSDFTLYFGMEALPPCGKDYAVLTE
jgi:hypothetical protein